MDNLCRFNNTGFELQRSQDGITFGKIGIVKSKGLNGNSSPMSYNFSDPQPGKGINYYRLKQIDLNGVYNFSSDVAIADTRPTTLVISNLFPIPATDILNIIVGSPDNRNIKFVITDIMGRTMLYETRKIAAGHSTLSFDVLTLSSGTYFIKSTCPNGCVGVTAKFVK